MMRLSILLVLLLAVVVFVILMWIISSYNRLVGLRNRFKNAFSQIDVQLKRRYDLIPNLVETAKGYMAHERQTLEAVIAARNAAVTANASAAADPRNASAVSSAVAAENTLVAALAQFRIVSEAYPNLKADQTMARLMEELT